MKKAGRLKTRVAIRLRKGDSFPCKRVERGGAIKKGKVDGIIDGWGDVKYVTYTAVMGGKPGHAIKKRGG